MKSTIPAFFHSYYDQLPKSPAIIQQNGPEGEGASSVKSGRKKGTSTPKGKVKNKPQEGAPVKRKRSVKKDVAQKVEAKNEAQKIPETAKADAVKTKRV